MKYLKKLIVHSIPFLCLILILSSCVHLRMTHLKDGELEWLYNFNKYTTCTFTSNYGGYSKLTVERLSIWNSRNPFYISSADPSFDYEATASVRFEILQNDSLLHGYLQFRKVLPEKTLEISGRFGNLNPKGHLRMDVVEYEYKGKLFKECIILDSLNSFLSRLASYPFERDVRKVVFSKEYGLVYYAFSDGEEFFREFKEATEIDKQCAKMKRLASIFFRGIWSIINFNIFSVWIN